MILPNRGILAVSGEDRLSFLNGLVTNEVGTTPAYACLLTAQGRFLHDFFVVPDGERLLIDCEAARREDLMARLKRFRLRAKVDVVDETENWRVQALLHNDRHSPRRRGIHPEIGFADPRHEKLGQRVLINHGSSACAEDDEKGNVDDDNFEAWDRTRITLGIPDGSRDMVPEEALLLENNIDRLNGIDWDKGCYVGQEVTARMHYKGGVKKRLVPVRIDGTTPAPGSIVMADNRQAGEMRSSCGDIGLALLRVEAAGEFSCGEATLTHATPDSRSDRRA